MIPIINATFIPNTYIVRIKKKIHSNKKLKNIKVYIGPPNNSLGLQKINTQSPSNQSNILSPYNFF